VSRDKKLCALRLGNSGPFVDHPQDEVAIGDRQKHVHAAARGGGGDRILHKIGSDQAKHSAAVAVQGAGEVRDDRERYIALCGGGTIALVDGGGEFGAGDFVANFCTDIAQQCDGFLDHPLHPFRVAGGGFPIGRTLRRDGSAQASDRTLQTVDQMRCNLAECRGLGGKGEFEMGAGQAIIAFGNRTLGALQAVGRSRLRDRKSLLSSFDQFRRQADASGAMEGLDSYQQQAMDVLTSSRLADAFDLSKEDPKTVARYGKGSDKFQDDGPWTRLDMIMKANRSPTAIGLLLVIAR